MRHLKVILLKLSILFLFVLTCSEPNKAPQKENSQTQENSKPNILFIFTDDQSFNTINALGGNEVITPNLDKLVKNGVSFTNSFNMGGWNDTICIASRTMMFTGKNIWEAEQADSLMMQKEYQNPLWSKLMAQAGYDTYLSGKWHIKKPAKEVFKTALNIRPGMPNQTPEGYNRPSNEADKNWQPWDKSKEGYWKGGKHWSEVISDDALTFMESIKQSQNPFFMYLAFNAPHDPRQSPKEFIDKYPLDKIDVPKNFLEEYPYKEEMGSGKNLRDEKLAPFPRTKHSVKAHLQEYYASITHMDEQIGKIIAALEASGKMDNTYIIFAADHGRSVGQHGLFGKQNMYEHSIRIPLLISGPDFPKNKKVGAAVYVQDIMPTVLELSQQKIPGHVYFNSMVSLAKGEFEKSHYPSVYGAYGRTQRMIRASQFKLIAYPEAKKLRLFNLKSDPEEMVDLIDDPKYQRIKKRLLRDLIRLQEEMKDPMILDPEVF